MTRSAELAKRAALLAIDLRLDALWARRLVFLSGLPSLPIAFPQTVGAVSYFTGTDGPHRKTAIQFMTGSGAILGYGKVTRNAEIAAYLSVEAKALDRVARMQLKSAGTPQLLGEGVANGARWIATDSRRGKTTSVPNGLVPMHVAFVRELAARTKRSDDAETIANMLALSAADADADWSRRFHRANALFSRWESDIETSFAHGDFTLWNSFIDSGGLYVFDWEYSRDGIPVGFDLVHLLLSRPTDMSAHDENERVVAQLSEIHFTGHVQRARHHYLLSLMAHASFYQDRQIRVGAAASGWSNADLYARLIDAMLSDIGSEF
ncbi:phosphotransferase [Parvibaculum sp.]|uniref:phosphotransferase n=1 Tax=Parvibaculum sp. TaxID=2024848 RepID=UPI0032980DCA